MSHPRRFPAALQRPDPRLVLPPGRAALALPRARSGGRPVGQAVSGSLLWQGHSPDDHVFAAGCRTGHDHGVADDRSGTVLGERSAGQQGSGGEDGGDGDADAGHVLYHPSGVGDGCTPPAHSHEKQSFCYYIALQTTVRHN